MFCCKIEKIHTYLIYCAILLESKSCLSYYVVFFIFAFETGGANTIHMGFMDWGSKCQSLLCSLHFQEITSHKKTSSKIIKLDQHFYINPAVHIFRYKCVLSFTREQRVPDTHPLHNMFSDTQSSAVLKIIGYWAYLSFWVHPNIRYSLNTQNTRKYPTYPEIPEIK